MNRINEQLVGFLNTPSLWYESELFNLKQFQLPNRAENNLNEIGSMLPQLSSNFVLGKRMEIFFEYLLSQSNQYEVVAKNLQIFSKKVTLGELDFLVKDILEDVFYHIELVYKFYLYDPGNEGETGWIGPNRKDSLLQKISRLKNHQLPLLRKEETREILTSYGLSAPEIIQKVCFKATLFIPQNDKFYKKSNVNKDCIAGYWIKFRDFSSAEYANHYFYAPKKQDWPIDPSANQEWVPFVEFVELLSEFMAKNRSPLVWMKNTTGGFERFFVVWW